MAQPNLPGFAIVWIGSIHQAPKSLILSVVKCSHLTTPHGEKGDMMRSMKSLNILLNTMYVTRESASVAEIAFASCPNPTKAITSCVKRPANALSRMGKTGGESETQRENDAKN